MKKNIFILLFLFSSCATVEYSNQNYSLYDLRYPDYGYVESAHFIINSPDSVYAREISDVAEKHYYSLMMDTNLFSFIQASPYRIIIHKNRDDFIKNTKAPKWSGGFINSNTIETYISSYTPCVLAHEITHLIMNEYLGEYSSMYLWIEEGLATYQERKACLEVEEKYSNIFKSKVMTSPYPFSFLISFKPKKTDKSSDVEKFYSQSSDIIKFMIQKEGSFKFYIFIESIKKGMDIDQALRNAYPGNFNDYYQLEKKWISERIK